MEEYIKSFDKNFIPNITLIDIAYPINQEKYPFIDFLKKITKQHPNFVIQIIIVNEKKNEDAQKNILSDLVEISEKNILTFIDDTFNYNINVDQKSKNFIMTQLLHTIGSKISNPNETHITIINDYNGYDILPLFENMSDVFAKVNRDYEHIYRHNILVNQGVQEPQRLKSWGSALAEPVLYTNNFGALEIINPIFLNDLDLACTFLYQDNNMRRLGMCALEYRFSKFMKKIPHNREKRLASLPHVINDAYWDFDCFNDFSFMGYYQMGTRFFGDIIKIYNAAKSIEDLMELEFLALVSKRAMLNFLENITIESYLDRIRESVVDYIVKNQKLPIFLEYLMQNKHQICYEEIYNYTIQYANDNKRLPEIYDNILADKDFTDSDSSNAFIDAFNKILSDQ